VLVTKGRQADDKNVPERNLWALVSNNLSSNRVGGWSEWSDADERKCSKSCGGGTFSRIRHCNHSKPCPREDGVVAVNEEKMFPCNTQPCPVDCPVAPWKDWSIDEGLVKKTIETIEQDGKPCPPLLMAKDCSSQKCPSVNSICVEMVKLYFYNSTAIYRKIDQEVNGRPVWKFEEKCLWWEGMYLHWWSSPCETLSTNVGYAWLDDRNAKCPYDGNEVWKLTGSDKHIPGMKVAKHGLSSGVLCCLTKAAREGPWTILFSHRDQLELEEDNLLTTLPILTKEWMIDFRIMATNLDHKNWTSIIHMKEEGSSNRIPAFFSNSSRVQVCFHVNGNPNYQETISGLKLNKWTHIVISQYGSRFKVVIGGRDEINVKNTQPIQFENVKVWATPPGSRAQPGYIKDLSIKVKL